MCTLSFYRNSCTTGILRHTLVKMAYDDDDEESEYGDRQFIQVQESRTPKMNKFVHDMSEWLTVLTVLFLLVYGCLYLFYQIALGMAHISWVYGVFAIVCAVDVIMYLLLRFAVVGGETNMCMVYLAFLFLVATFVVNVGAPGIVLVSYELTLTYTNLGSGNGTSSGPVDETPPQDCGLDDSGFKCGVVRSIRTSIWCMYILLVPKPLLFYGIVGVVRGKGGGGRRH